MKTTISFSVLDVEAKRTRHLARVHGFATISQYIRFLLSQDDVELIPEQELVHRATESQRLHSQKKLIRAKSMADLV